MKAIYRSFNQLIRLILIGEVIPDRAERFEVFRSKLGAIVHHLN